MAGYPATPKDQAYIERHSCPEPNGCRLWQRSTNGRGYGSANNMGSQILAHRLAYELYRGPIPPGLFVLHKCDTPLCVNPEHLFLGTHHDNMADMDAKGRRHKGGNQGVANPNTSLSQACVVEIFKSNESAGKVARRFGLVRQSVDNIRAGRTWAAITEGLTRG